MRMAMIPSCEAASRHINNHGRQHQKNRDPETQTAMGAFPVGTVDLKIATVIRAVVWIMVMHYFTQCFPVRASPNQPHSAVVPE